MKAKASCFLPDVKGMQRVAHEILPHEKRVDHSLRDEQ